MKESYTDYFTWLCELVCVDGRYTDESYWQLARILFDTVFTWINPMDEDRAVDGEDMRGIYHDDGGNDIFEGDCTVLEMLIALARRMDNLLDELDGEDRIPMYFWEMIDNLELSNFSDYTFEEHWDRSGDYLRRIYDKVDRWLERDIEYNGKGGPFPLRNPARDQKYVDIWYQANAYMVENYM